MDSKIKNLKSKKTKVEKKTIMERIEMLSDLEKKALKKLCKFQILNNTPVKLFLVQDFPGKRLDLICHPSLLMKNQENKLKTCF